MTAGFRGLRLARSIVESSGESVATGSAAAGLAPAPLCAHTYGFGLPMVAAFAVPPAVVVWWTRPDTLVQLALLGTVLLSVLRLMLTSERLRVRRFANGAEPLLSAVERGPEPLMASSTSYEEVKPAQIL
jgi:hypothetical protein